MVHYTTSNLSALKMTKLFEDMGIENSNMHLELLDEDLLEVDPFSDNLDSVTQAKILRECINNPWYFFREIVRIPAGGSMVRFEFHRGNIALIWAVYNDISQYTVWPRQAYKSTSYICAYLHLTYFGGEHFRISFMAHEDSLVKKNLQELKVLRDNLPPYLNLYDRKKDKDNEKEIHNTNTDNKIICRAPPRSEDTARKAGRGFTTQMQWFDEVGFIKFISLLYDSISFAYSKASEAAKENGNRYHQAFSTTAGFLDTPEGAWGFKFLNSCADFSEAFYDMDIEMVKDIIDNTSSSGFLRLEMMYYDLGKDENYLEAQKKRLANSDTPEDTLQREVLNRWKDTSTNHPLGQERIEKLNKMKRAPNDVIVINDVYTMRIYKDMDKFNTNKVLVAGQDLGGNLKGDFSTFVVVDPGDFSVVAVMRVNTQSTTLFAMAVVTIMVKLFPNLILYGERNFNGAILDLIVQLLPQRDRKRVFHEKEDRPGIFNSKKIRPTLYNDILKVSVDNYAEGICDRNIISEIEGLIRTRTGRIDHKQGEHDDTLIAYLLALYFLIHEPRKGEYIDESIILSRVNKVNESDSIQHNIRWKGFGMRYNSSDETLASYRELNGLSNGSNTMDGLANKLYDVYSNENPRIDGRVEIVDPDSSNIDDLEEVDSVEEATSISRDIRNKGTVIDVEVMKRQQNQTTEVSDEDLSSFWDL